MQTTEHSIQARDWPEDFSHENGNYQCRCTTCGQMFTGHKRRVTCKICATQLPEDLRRFIVQLETVADHCDETGLRAGGATVREAIERLSRATPTPDVAGLLMKAETAIRWLEQDGYLDSVRILRELVAAIETQSRERALRSSAMLSVKLELHKFCVGDTVRKL